MSISEDAMARQLGGVADVVNLLGGCDHRSRVMRVRSVRASVTPVAPDSPQTNVVTYRGRVLADHVAPVRDWYESSGVHAWAAWVPEDDRRTAAALKAEGYRHTATLPAMVRPLSTHVSRWDDAAEIDRDGDVETLGRINEAAWGLAPGTITGAFRHSPASGPSPTVYRAWLDQRVVAALCTIKRQWKSGSDLGISWLGTLPEARGRGIGSALIAAALDDAAADNGCTTASLQASAQGERIYRKLGFQTVGCFDVYEMTTT
jgi:ribosomal protein S18 acetylase RimI-like enzyme